MARDEAEPNSALTAERVITLLGLVPHPEGGYFRETFRDGCIGGTRAASTAIYFLLKKGQISRWHTVDAAEIWHHYSGAPLMLDVVSSSGSDGVRYVLGSDLNVGERPQAIVPPGHWQRASSQGDWTLAGCTVAPGFEFSGFFVAADGFDPHTAT